MLTLIGHVARAKAHGARWKRLADKLRREKEWSIGLSEASRLRHDREVATLTAERDRAQSALVVEQRMAADAGAQEFRAMRELAEVKVDRDALRVRLARARGLLKEARWSAGWPTYNRIDDFLAETDAAPFVDVPAWLDNVEGTGPDMEDEQIDMVYGFMDKMIRADRFDIVEEAIRGVSAERVADWPLTTSLAFLSITVPVMDRLASVRRPLLALITEKVKGRPDAAALLAGLAETADTSTGEKT